MSGTGQGGWPAETSIGTPSPTIVACQGRCYVDGTKPSLVHTCSAVQSTPDHPISEHLCTQRGTLRKSCGRFLKLTHSVSFRSGLHAFRTRLHDWSAYSLGRIND